jgi:hypothetical protein
LIENWSLTDTVFLLLKWNPIRMKIENSRLCNRVVKVCFSYLPIFQSFNRLAGRTPPLRESLSKNIDKGLFIYYIKSLLLSQQ